MRYAIYIYGTKVVVFDKHMQQPEYMRTAAYVGSVDNEALAYAIAAQIAALEKANLFDAIGIFTSITKKITTI
jgi:hypothetical protein